MLVKSVLVGDSRAWEWAVKDVCFSLETFLVFCCMLMTCFCVHFYAGTCSGPTVQKLAIELKDRH